MLRDDAKEATKALVECSRLVGAQFCQSVVQVIRETLSADCALLAKIDEKNPCFARTVAVCNKDGTNVNFVYPLVGSPCQNVMNHDSSCHYPNRVVDLFPEDALLVEMGVQGYFGTPLLNHVGQPIGVLAVLSKAELDIPDDMIGIIEILAGRASAEIERDKETSQSEFLGRLVEGSSNEHYVFRADSLQFIMVNRAARSNLGYSEAELAKLTPLDLKPDVSETEFAELIAPLQLGETSVVRFKTRHRRKNATLYPVEVSLQLIDDQNEGVFFASIQDITRFDAAEQKLEATEQRLGRIFEQSPAGIVEADSTGRMILVNRAWCEMLGYSRGELLEKTIFEVTHPDSLFKTNEALQRLIAGENGVIIDKSYVHRNGKVINATSNVNALRDADGSFVGIAAVVSDITDRLAAEEQVRTSERMMRMIIDRAMSFIGLLDPAGTLLEANEVAIVSSGIERDELVGKKFWECYWWSYDSLVAAQLKSAVEKAANGENVRYDATIRTKGDGRLQIDFMLSPILDKNGKTEYIVPTALDITHRVKQENMLKNLMHETNHRTKNILSVVQGILRFMDVTDPEQLRTEFEKRISSLAKCQDLLIDSGWSSVALRDVIQSQTAHLSHAGDRICLNGPPIDLQPDWVQPISMAIYELVTNAVKYGALCNEVGTVDITWSVNAISSERTLTLGWCERGGPVVKAPQHRGFGSTVLNRVVTAATTGRSEISYSPEGLQWQLVCPLPASVTET